MRKNILIPFMILCFLSENILASSPMSYYSYGKIQDFDVGKNGEYVVTSGAVTILWDVEQGTPIHVFPRKEWLGGVFIHNDQQWIVDVNRQETNIWDIESGTLIKQLPIYCDYPRRMDLSPDGNTLAFFEYTPTSSDTLKVWNLETEKEIYSRFMYGNGDPTFSPDGETLIISDQTHFIPAFDTKTWEVTNGYDIFESHSAIFSPDGSHLLLISWEFSIGNFMQLWNTEPFKQIIKVQIPEGNYSLDYSLDNQHFLVAAGNTVQIRDAQTYQQTVIQLHSDISQVRFAADGNSIFVRYNTDTLERIEIPSGLLLRTYGPFMEELQQVDVSHDQSTILLTSKSKHRLLDQSGRIEMELEYSSRPIQSGALSPDGRYGIFVKNDMQAVLHDLDDGSLVHEFSPGFRVDYVEFLPEDRLLTANNSIPWAAVWDVNNGKLIQKFRFLNTHFGICQPLQSPPSYIHPQPVQRLWNVYFDQPILFAFHDGLVGWNIDSQEMIHFSEQIPNSGTMQFHLLPNGHQAIFHNGDEISMWDWRTETNQILLKSEEPYSIHFMTSALSHDGRYLAIAFFHDRLHPDSHWIAIGDLATGKEITRFIGHNDEIQSLQFSKDNSYLFSAGNDGLAIRWETNLKTPFVNPEDVFPKMDRLPQQPVHALSLNIHNYLVNIDFLSNDEAIALGGHMAQIWKLEPERQIRYIDLEEYLYCSTLSEDSRFIVTGDHLGYIHLWNVATGEKNKTFGPHDYRQFNKYDGSSAVLDVDISPNNQLIVSSGQDETIRLWDVQNGEETKRLDVYQSSLQFFSDGKRILCGDLIWDIVSDTLFQEIPYTIYFVGKSILHEPDENQILYTDYQSLRLLDRRDKNHIFSLQTMVDDFDFSPTDPLFAFTNKGVTGIGNTRDGRILLYFSIRDVEQGFVRFSPDGKYLLTSGPGDNLFVWNIQELRIHQPSFNFQFKRYK